MPFPKAPGSQRAKLFLIVDDHSRLLVHGRWCPWEKLRSGQEVLRQAIERRGLPEQLYDLGTELNVVLRQRAGGDGHRPLQDRAGPETGALADGRRAGAGDRPLGRMVEPAPAPWWARRCAAGRVRGAPRRPGPRGVGRCLSDSPARRPRTPGSRPRHRRPPGASHGLGVGCDAAIRVIRRSQGHSAVYSWWPGVGSVADVKSKPKSLQKSQDDSLVTMLV